MFAASVPPVAFAQSTGLPSGADALLYRSSLAVAEKSLRLNETDDAVRWLDKSPEHLRGWEWDFLHSMCDECVQCVSDAPESITAIDVSPDGKLLAAGDAQGQVALYKLPEFQRIRTLGDHSQAVYSLAFSADGQHLATVSRDVTSRVWDVESGKEISKIQLDNPGVAAVTFSPDGQLVATSSWLMLRPGDGSSVRGAVWIWEAETGKVLHKKEVGVKPLDSIAWSTDGATLVVGSWGGLVHVLDREGTEVRKLEVPDAGIYTAVIGVAISPDGKWVAAGSKDRTARIWKLEDGTLQATCSSHSGFVNEVRFSNDSERLISCSVDGTIRTWNAQSGAPLNTLRGHTRDISAIDCLGDGEQLVSASKDKTFRVWDLDADYGSRLAARTEASGTYSTVFSPDGTRIYCAMYGGQVVVLNAQTGATVSTWDAHAGKSCNTLAMNGDGSQLLTCSWDKTAKLWNANDRSLVATLDAGGGVYACDLSKDSRLAALAVGKEIQIWDVTEKKLRGTCTGHEGTVVQVSLSPDGLWLASAAGEKDIRIWDVKPCSSVAVLNGHKTPVSSVAFSTDGQRLVSGGVGEVVFWDPAKHQSIRHYMIGDRPVNRLSFSPDGNRVAVGADVITIIDPADDEPLLRFQPQDDDIYYLSFSPDGRRLASCTTGGSIVINESIPAKARVDQTR